MTEDQVFCWIMVVLGAISLVSVIVGIRVLLFPTVAEMEQHLERWAD
jgi:hypothetical protein